MFIFCLIVHLKFSAGVMQRNDSPLKNDPWVISLRRNDPSWVISLRREMIRVNTLCRQIILRSEMTHGSLCRKDHFCTLNRRVTLGLTTGKQIVISKYFA